MRFLPTISSLMASFVLAILVSAPVAAQQDRQPMVDMVIQIQQLQDEVRTLTGRIEDQSLELENLRDRQRDQYLDLDQRIGELRSSSLEARISGSANTLSAGATTSGTKYTSQSATPPRGDIPDVRPPSDTPSSVTALANPDTQAREMVASPVAEKKAYERAFQSLKDLKYVDSANQFQSFLQQYPSSEYADNAQYWLGESYYVTRNYDLALEAFQGLSSRYPDSPKVADGLLKIGYSHYELKQWDQARAALEQVQQQYPGTTLARLAGSRLRSLKLEGHY